jgi:hypothetical protein
MRIVLQHRDSGLYFRDVGAWTENAPEALDFVDSTKALEFCAANKLSDLQIVLKFEESAYDIVLPVNPPIGANSNPGKRA